MTEKEIKKLADIIDYTPEHINKTTLIDNNLHAAMLFAMKKGQSLPKHSSPVDAFVYVIEGEIDFTLYKNADTCCDSCMCTVSSNLQESSDSVEIKTFEIKKEEIFIFEKDIEHAVLAKKTQKFWLYVFEILDNIMLYKISFRYEKYLMFWRQQHIRFCSS